MGRSVIYFANLGAEGNFSKIRCSELSFPKEVGVSVIYPLIYYAIFTFMSHFS
jgi:hypothetical protein